MNTSSQLSYGGIASQASAVVSKQDFPTGALYVIATPIGNLADITLRALHTLSICDILACEDTRESKNLLKNYGIDKPASAFLSLHQHNEAEQSPLILSALSLQKRVGLLCDAGTPSISDPGSWLVHCAREQGHKIIPIPGVSSITALLSVCGMVSHSSFSFVGFLPTKSAQRHRLLSKLAKDDRAHILLEAPHRIAILAQELSMFSGRSITIARELTKQFEEIVTLSIDQMGQWIAQDPNRSRGEFVMAIHPNEAIIDSAIQDSQQYRDILEVLLGELSLKSAVRLAQLLTGASKNELYEIALQITKANL